MKTMMMVVAGAMAFSAIAQEAEVPAPVAVPAPIAVAAPAPVPSPFTVPQPVAVVDSVVDDLNPGALCRLYYRGINTYKAQFRDTAQQIDEWIEDASPVDQYYDDKSIRFDAKCDNGKTFDIAKWDGVFVAKVPGEYIISFKSGYACGIGVGDKAVRGVGQGSFRVELKKGPNKVSIWRFIRGKGQMIAFGVDESFYIDYRLASSAKKAVPLTPAKLQHVAMDDEGWDQ